MPKNQTIREQVVEFHQAMGVPTLDKPNQPPDERVRLRLKLIAEEFMELLDACLEDKGGVFFTKQELAKLIERPVKKIDLAELADACADLDYVVEGTRLEFGVEGEPIARLVHEANMKKTGGPKRADGKQLKPTDWKPPDIASEIARQQGKS